MSVLSKIQISYLRSRPILVSLTDKSATLKDNEQFSEHCTRQ